MDTRSGIISLGKRYGIEFPHVEQVAVLALQIFDGFSWVGLESADRDVLQAAALLHDIGYAADSEHHVQAGVAILQQNRIEGFSEESWALMVAVVLLHQRDWRSALDHDLFCGLSAMRAGRVKALAAILRVADGLDHGHIQDIRIIQCRRGAEVDRIRVGVGWYAGNIPWAEDKADLWEAHFKRPLRFEGRVEKRKQLFKGVVLKSDSTKSAARKILYSQFSIMRDVLPGMFECRDPEYLHDFRVAMRRFRVALKVFRPVLEGNALYALEPELSALSGDLGAIRDLHLKCSYLCSMENEWKAANDRLIRILEDRNCEATIQEIARILRTSFSGPDTSVGFERFSEQLLPELLDKTCALEINDRNDSGQVHGCRKQGRRGRYSAEFMAPVLGKEAGKAAKHLKAIATALGDIRDVETILELCKASDQLLIPEETLRKTVVSNWEKYEKSQVRLLKVMQEVKRTLQA